VRDRIPTLEAVPWQLQSRHYRWWMFLLRLFQGQMMRLR
jgi:hypothetical protein